ncbi:MAG: hypothetical protein P4L26_15300 [Terracidiphilus sp.]|nr:hypothetical protein [Terracidiphilus sp.]
MAIIVVGGSNRGVGKTTLVCALIGALTEYRWTAVKVTTHEHRQPVSPSRALSADDPAQKLPRGLRAQLLGQILEKGRAEWAGKPGPGPASSPIWEETTPGEETDTGRYLAAGAARALLVSALDGELNQPLNQLWPRFGRGTNFIFESNSVVHHVRPDVCLLIHGVAERELPLPERKLSFLAALRHADAMVARARADKAIPEGLSLAGPEPTPEQPPAPRPIFQLRALNRLSPELLAWLRVRLAPPQHF